MEFYFARLIYILKKTFGTRIPPPELLFLTTGLEDSNHFVETGKASIKDIERILDLYGKKIEDFERVLDFGVGAGRIARSLGNIKELIGVDILPENIEYLQKNMKFGKYFLNFENPPLLFEDNYFDLIINHSVFTHINVAHQDAWLAELSRVLKPEGFALLSFHGDMPFDGYVKGLRHNNRSEVALIQEREYLEKGFVWVTDDIWSDTKFPDWYHTMFQSPQYVLNHWSRWFEILNWNKCGNLNYQDNVLLKKRIK
jgi:SAM-dependent methyltransferase